MLVDYVKEMGYTHVELMPIMEHPFDDSWGYQVTGYYAPTSRYGTPEDFMYFVDDTASEQGIGVILDWVPAHFPRDAYWTGALLTAHAVYEHARSDDRGDHPHWGTLIYNYGRPQVNELPDRQRTVLGGKVPCRRYPYGCGGFDAVSGLWKERR